MANIYLNISKSKFVKNEGFIEGGVIKWTNNKPIIDIFSIFNKNNAFYGNDLASFPIRLQVKFFSIESSK